MFFQFYCKQRGHTIMHNIQQSSVYKCISVCLSAPQDVMWSPRWKFDDPGNVYCSLWLPCVAVKGNTVWFRCVNWLKVRVVAVEWAVEEIFCLRVQIEACAIHLLEEEARRVVGSPSKLSQEELVYAKEWVDLWREEGGGLAQVFAYANRPKVALPKGMSLLSLVLTSIMNVNQHNEGQGWASLIDCGMLGQFYGECNGVDWRAFY